MCPKVASLDELQAEYRHVSLEKLVVGALVETILSEDDGLVFNNGRTEKPKKIIVIGFDKTKETFYGSVLINTEMSPKSFFSAEYLSTQYCISAINYPDFLDYDSYADCGVIFSIPATKLLSGKYFGTLTDEDRAGIFEILETTDVISTKVKKQFGIRRR